MHTEQEQQILSHKEDVASISTMVDLALSLANASNYVGVVGTVRAMSVGLAAYDSKWLKKGTGWVNHHPVIVLMTQVLSNIVGLGIMEDGRYSVAYDWCLAWRNGETSDPDYTTHAFYGGTGS